ncbi:hypothetical protein TFLX_05313 [Thermoflexales bacterium]|nr:hypothetical protein TFLX_05313 [Thermoflexales bacterium]
MTICYGLTKFYFIQVLLECKRIGSTRFSHTQLITSDIRRVIRTHDELARTLAAQSVAVETLDMVLSQLVDSRLLRVEETEGEPAYELAHDYLLGEIKLDPAVQARKAAQELLDQEVHAYQHYGTLLNDDKLAIIETRHGELTLNADAMALIQKSERALKRRQRFVVGGVGLVIALFIAGMLSMLAAVGAQGAADQARKQQATSEAGAAAAATREVVAKRAEAVASTSEANANQAAVNHSPEHDHADRHHSNRVRKR